MKPDIIDRTEAGHQMDVLIATMVMGWSPRTMLITAKPPKQRNVPSWNRVHGLDLPQHAWNPSTSIAHAWKVVEHLQRENQWHLTLEWVNDNDQWEWFAVFCHETGGLFHPRFADTAPLAICRAALESIDWENRCGRTGIVSKADLLK